MAVITIIDEEKWSLLFHPDARIVHHIAKTPLYGSEFRDMLSRGADYLEKNRATKWLSDDRRNGAISPEDNEWGDSIWAPRVIGAGFKYWAIVVPRAATGSLQMRRLCGEFRKRGVTAEVFETPETAMAWLKSVG
jgi:hypothetical protein